MQGLLVAGVVLAALPAAALVARLTRANGALIVYDAATLAEVKRIPMNKPVGKYNVHNKIMRSEGTSP